MGVARVTKHVVHSMPPGDTAEEKEWGVFEFGDQGVACRSLVLEPRHDLSWWQS